VTVWLEKKKKFLRGSYFNGIYCVMVCKESNGQMIKGFSMMLSSHLYCIQMTLKGHLVNIEFV